MRTPVPAKESEKGQSLVELAVVIVILLVLLAGVIDLGGLLFQYIAMRDGAQEGAVYASVYPTACNQASARVRESLHNPDPTQVEVAILVNGVACEVATAADACASKEIKVTVRQPQFRLTTPFLGAFIGTQTIDLSANVASTIIRPVCP